MAGNGESTLFQFTRIAILKEYEADGRQFKADTAPYISTLPIQWDVVSATPAALPVMAFAVARSQQIVEWFSYGVGAQIPFTQGTTKAATEADTNVSNARRTNGIEDMIIEALSATNKGNRVEYLASDIGAAITDVDARASYLGQRTILDPGALLGSPQAFSPFNLQNTLFEALKPFMSIEFEWDRVNVLKIGRLDELPEGGAKSYLQASGEPTTQNRFKVPEGYAWRHQGKPNSEFIVRGRLTEAVVVPITLIGLNGQSATLTTPQRLYTDITVRAHGLRLAHLGPQGA